MLVMGIQRKRDNLNYNELPSLVGEAAAAESANVLCEL